MNALEARPPGQGTGIALIACAEHTALVSGAAMPGLAVEVAIAAPAACTSVWASRCQRLVAGRAYPLRVTDGQGTQAEPGEQDGTTQAEAGENAGQVRPERKPRWRDRPTIRALGQDVRCTEAASDRRDNEARGCRTARRFTLAGLSLPRCTRRQLPPLCTGRLRTAGDARREREMDDASGRGQERAGTYGWQVWELSAAATGRACSMCISIASFPTASMKSGHACTSRRASLTLMVATFTLADQAGHLSEILRADYQGEIHIDIRALGRFSRARSHIPWSRPPRVRHVVDRGQATDQRRLACEARSRRTKPPAGPGWQASSLAGSAPGSWRTARRCGCC